MIKILFFIDTLKRGGAAKVLLNLVNAMDKSRFDIVVQTIYKENVDGKLNDNIKYKYCYARKNALTWLLLRIETMLRIIYRLHIKDNYDFECAYLESISTKIISTSTNQKSVRFAWVHCDIEKMIGTPYEYVRKTKAWYDKYDSVICVSESVRSSFCRVFGNDYDTKVLYNAIDSSDIVKAADLPIPCDLFHNKTTILTAGTLYPPKNHIRLLKACKRLLNDGYDFDAWILGDGQDRQLLESFISKNNLQSNVHLLGFYSNPYPLMKSADILACSSDYEGFSTFVTEGLILGKAIVTTDVSGMRELLGDSEYGLITEIDDDDFYKGLKRMISEPLLRERYAEKSVRRGAEFSLNATTKMAEALFGIK